MFLQELTESVAYELAIWGCSPCFVAIWYYKRLEACRCLDVHPHSFSGT